MTMPTQPQPVGLDAVLLAMLDRAASGRMDDHGHLDPDTQADLDALADLADDPERLAAVLGDEGGVARHAEAGPGDGIPPVVQSTGWTCGAAALAAVAQFFGCDLDEADAAKLAGANPDQGTPPDAMQRALQRLGLTVQAVERMGLPQLGRSLIMGRPVLVCLQALDADPEAETAGHWVVISGRNGTGYQVADPAHGRVEVSRQELLDRWHDMDASGRVYTRFGLIVAE